MDTSRTNTGQLDFNISRTATSRYWYAIFPSPIVTALQNPKGAILVRKLDLLMACTPADKMFTCTVDVEKAQNSTCQCTALFGMRMQILKKIPTLQQAGEYVS